MTSDLSPDPSGLFSLEEGEQYVEEVGVFVVWLYHIARGRRQIYSYMYMYMYLSDSIAIVGTCTCSS